MSPTNTKPAASISITTAVPTWLQSATFAVSGKPPHSAVVVVAIRDSETNHPIWYSNAFSMDAAATTGIVLGSTDDGGFNWDAGVPLPPRPYLGQASLQYVEGNNTYWTIISTVDFTVA